MPQMKHLKPIQIDANIHQCLMEHCKHHGIKARYFLEKMICDRIGIDISADEPIKEEPKDAPST